MAFLTGAARQRGSAALRLARRHGWKTAVLGALAIWLLVVGAHHEPWVDEGQAWLIARDSGLMSLLTEHVRYEGTPGLWYLILWLCIRCGLPFAGLYLLPVSCALAGAALLLWRAPFPVILRVLVAGSYFFGYQYAVVARSYALDLVLLPGLAILFAKRTEKPFLYGLLIGLLANCNAHSFLLAGVLGGEWLLALIRGGRLRQGWSALSLAAVLGLCALLTAWQPADNGFLHPDMQPPPLSAGLRFIGEAFIDRLAFWRAPFLDEQSHGIAVSLLLLIPSLLLFHRARLLPLLAALIAVLVGFSAFTYASAWHSGILFLIWIFGLWVAWPALGASTPLKRAVIASLAIVGTVQAAEAARTGWWDIHHSYSGSAQASQALVKLRADHPQMRLAAAGFKAFAVQPYVPGNVFANYHGGAARPSYIVWKRSEAWRAFETLPEAYKALAEGDDALLMSDFSIAPSDLVRFKRSAEAQGYREVAIYPGGLEWKGYVREDDALILFVRGSAS